MTTRSRLPAARNLGRARSIPKAVAAVATAAAFVLLAACHHDAPRDSETTAASAAPAETKPPAAELHEDTFDLVIRPAGPYASGQPGAAEVQVTAKGGYHCNDKYPYKFKVTEAPGVHFAAPVFDKSALTLETSKATMKLEFTPDSKGEKTIAGVFSFSLCSAERCLVEKRDVATKIAVD
jgi:hypothetical protein